MRRAAVDFARVARIVVPEDVAEERVLGCQRTAEAARRPPQTVQQLVQLSQSRREESNPVLIA